MTEQTVPVPVEYLQALKEEFPKRSTWVEGAVAAIVNLIPDPPKVGDVVTAESVKGLPAGAVLRDITGDIWLVGPDARLSYLTPARPDPRVFGLSDPAWDVYEPVIISLPRD